MISTSRQPRSRYDCATTSAHSRPRCRPNSRSAGAPSAARARCARPDGNRCTGGWPHGSLALDPLTAEIRQPATLNMRMSKVAALPEPSPRICRDLVSHKLLKTAPTRDGFRKRGCTECAISSRLDRFERGTDLPPNRGSPTHAIRHRQRYWKRVDLSMHRQGEGSCDSTEAGLPSLLFHPVRAAPASTMAMLSSASLSRRQSELSVDLQNLRRRMGHSTTRRRERERVEVGGCLPPARTHIPAESASVARRRTTYCFSRLPAPSTLRRSSEG